MTEVDEIMRILGKLEALVGDSREDIKELKKCMLEKHITLEDRISKLEAFRNRVIGYAAAIATPVGAAAAAVTNLLAGGSQPGS